MNAQPTYETDVIAWSQEQARLLRARQFDQLDIEHIADEVEDVGKSEQRELASRMAILIAHLLKWQLQAGRRGASWQRTIREQRKAIAYDVRKTSSLKSLLGDTEWRDVVWSKAVAVAAEETGLDAFPDTCPWSVEHILSPEFFPIN
jgi:hypothetical protein